MDPVVRRQLVALRDHLAAVRRAQALTVALALLALLASFGALLAPLLLDGGCWRCW